MPVSRAGIPLWALTSSIAIHLAVLTLTGFSKPASLRSYKPAASIQLRLVPADGFSSNAGRGGEARSERDAARFSPNQSGQPNPDASGAGKAGVESDSSVPETGLPGFADYLPKAYLSVGPEPLTPIEIQSPADFSGKPTATVELMLFIDEYGKVQMLRVESDDATKPFVDAARQAFENATFKPGTLAGKAVKSVIKIAVDFE